MTNYANIKFYYADKIREIREEIKDLNAQLIFNKNQVRPHYYGNGNASQKIVAHILNFNERYSESNS